MTITFAVLLGFALDWLLGDPKKLPHPVCAIGKLISGIEKVLRRIFPATPASLTFAGIVLWLITCGVSFVVPFFLLRWLYHVNFWLGFAAETLLCWMIFARKSLADAGYHVYGAVKQSLEEGRKAIAWYVGRDTAELSEEGVIKAAVETVAENLTDGVVSPLVFMLIGGRRSACCTRRSTRWIPWSAIITINTSISASFRQKWTIYSTLSLPDCPHCA